jgi:hypothetical protein
MARSMNATSPLPCEELKLLATWRYAPLTSTAKGHLARTFMSYVGRRDFDHKL